MTITFLAPDGVQATAMQFRQARAVLRGGGSGRQLGGRSGFRVGTPSNVLTASATTWTLGPCAIGIDADAVAYQGVYDWATDANVTGTVTAADATNPRKDIVYIQINDSSAGDGTGLKTADVLYLAGSPNVSPVAPALPARSFLVGTITVPQAGGGSPTVVRNPAVHVAAGATLPVASLAERDALTKYDGLRVQRTDLTGRIDETWDAAAGAWVASPVMLGRYAPLAVNSFATTGDIVVEQMGTRKRVSVNVRVTRTAATSIILSGTFTNLGVILPPEARGGATGNEIYMALGMVGGGMNELAQGTVHPVTGQCYVSAPTNLSFPWVQYGLVTFNCWYML